MSTSVTKNKRNKPSRSKTRNAEPADLRAALSGMVDVLERLELQRALGMSSRIIHHLEEEVRMRRRELALLVKRNGGKIDYRGYHFAVNRNDEILWSRTRRALKGGLER